MPWNADGHRSDPENKWEHPYEEFIFLINVVIYFDIVLSSLISQKKNDHLY